MLLETGNCYLSLGIMRSSVVPWRFSELGGLHPNTVPAIRIPYRQSPRATSARLSLEARVRALDLAYQDLQRRSRTFGVNLRMERKIVCERTLMLLATHTMLV